VSDSAAIDIKGVSKGFSNGWLGKKQVIANLDFQIRDNEVFGYLGGNGAGKTTTFKLMLGLIRPDRGEIRFWGRSAEDRQTRALIGYLPEQPYFHAYLTGREALDFYAGLFGMPGKQRKKRIGALLDLVGLAQAQHTRLHKYSRGMLQRIGIAQALVNDPRLLILDEPMSGLDPMGRKAMRDIILSCRDQGKTIIFSSHIISDVEMICDRAGILANGRLRQTIALDGTLASDDSPREITCQGGILDLSGIDSRKNITHLVRGNRHIISAADKKTADRVMEKIRTQGLELVSFSAPGKRVEEIYLTSTGQDTEPVSGEQESRHE